LSWRGDSKVLASCSEDGSVKWWETQDGKQAKSWNAHGDGALWVNFAHDGRLVSCGRDNQITLWDANGGKVRAFDFLGDLPLRVTFNHDDTRIFAADFAGRVAAWTVADGKRVGELDANPAPLAEQLAAAEKRVAELQHRGSNPSSELPAAEAGLARATEEMDQATKALEQAKAEQAATEQEVVRLKEEAARNPPPADIQLRLAAARETRGKARAARTNATEVLQGRTRQTEALREKLAQLKSDDPAEALAAAKGLVFKLKAAQAQATVFRARESLAARKREHEKLLAVAAARQEAADQAARDFDAASDSAARSKLKAALKSATAEAKAAQSAAKKLAGEIASEQARLDKLAAEAEKVKTASAPTQQQSKL
jgi:chromosome segregation ATPase